MYRLKQTYFAERVKFKHPTTIKGKTLQSCLRVKQLDILTDLSLKEM